MRWRSHSILSPILGLEGKIHNGNHLENCPGRFHYAEAGHKGCLGEDTIYQMNQEIYQWSIGRLLGRRRLEQGWIISIGTGRGEGLS
jgi:hypothetical protein